MPALVAAMVAFALLGSTMRTAVNDSDALATAGTIFAGVFVQALPFLAVGVLLSALIAVFVTPDRLARWLPKRPGAAVLVAAASGAALPGCECGSV
ncbi:MAG: permease, partial [Mycobacterium sp.]